MVKFSFKGPLVPVFTAFNNDRTKSLNLEVIPKYAKYLADNGYKGVLVNGTTGEGVSQTIGERKLLAEKWMETKKDTNLHIMLQIGGAPMPDVLEMARHAESIGVDSVLCLAELYFKPRTTNDLINYLRIVGEAAPNTPLLYYHIPMFTESKIHMGQFLRDVDGKIPTFVGIKFTSEDLKEGLDAVSVQNKKYAVFLGADTLMLEAYQKGFDSSIATSFNIFPEYGVKIHQLVFSGKAEEAKPHQEKLSKIVGSISKYGSWVQTMKVAMNLYSPIQVGPVRDPLIELPPAQVKNMEEDVKAV